MSNKIHKPTSAILAFINANKTTVPKGFRSVSEWATIFGTNTTNARHRLNTALHKNEAERIEAKGTDVMGRVSTIYYYKVYGYEG